MEDEKKLDFEKSIADFRSKIDNFTLEELQSEKRKIDNDISKMILNSDLILKAAILETKIEEKTKESK
jgi:hypothetical protein